MGKLIDQLEASTSTAPSIARLLAAYAEALRPWARRIAFRMLSEVDRRDLAAWSELGHAISAQLHRDIRRTDVGQRIRERLADQVELITSIPREAGERVHQLALRSLESGERAREAAREIRRSTEVTESRALLIARTEVARTAATLVQARAEHAGSTHYIWRTAQDSAVRPGHKVLEGRVFPWNNPPAVKEGDRVIRHHPGEIWNCFTARTLVDPTEALAVLRGMYRGELVTFFVGNTAIEATANHPILTPNGWIRAGALKEGDEVLTVAEYRAHSVVDHVKKRLQPFGEVFEAVAFGREIQNTAKFNLYGDPIKHEIDVVTVYRDLTLNIEPELHEQIGNEVIPRANVRVLGEWVQRCCTQIFDSLLSGTGNLLAPLGWSEAFHLQSIRGTATPGDAFALDDGIHSVGSYPQLLRDRRTPKSLRIETQDFLDGQRQIIATIPRRVTRLERSFWQGHVYTLQTRRGLYPVGATGVIAANCRCYAEPILPDPYELRRRAHL